MINYLILARIRDTELFADYIKGTFLPSFSTEER